MNHLLYFFKSLYVFRGISYLMLYWAKRFPWFWSRRFFYWMGLYCYLLDKPSLRAQMGFETDRAQGSQYGVFLYYDYWPAEWFQQLLDYYIAFDNNEDSGLAGCATSSRLDARSRLSRLSQR